MESLWINSVKSIKAEYSNGKHLSKFAFCEKMTGVFKEPLQS